jgi:hypothetical protein
MLIDEVRDSLEMIKTTGKVDQSLLGKLDELSNLFKGHKEMWLMSPNTRINLYFYYAARIAELVAVRIKERLFVQVYENNKNLEISQNLIALLGDVLDLTQKKLPDEASVKSVMERSRELRAIATTAKLLEPNEKELLDVDKLLSYLSKLRK